MGEVNGVDRISELPEPIVHHIMSFLHCPKDVARTVILSKKWRAIWGSFFTIDLDQRKFLAQEKGGARNDKFKKFVENSLATKLEPMVGLRIQKFRLYLTSFYPRLAPHLTHWLSVAINKNVKELEIHVEGKKNVGYILPENAFTANTLTSLKLYGCNLDHYGVTDLPNLKELSIKNTHLTLDIILTFIQICPLVEDLRLVHCIGLEGLFLSDNTKLKKVEVQECHGLKVIEVDLPNLTTFLYCGKKFWVCKINLAGCQSLRYLTLQGSNMTDEYFHNQLTKFPDLEKLALKECNILGKIKILSKKLREISIVRCKKLEEVIVDTPNLDSLEYTGDTFPFSSMNVASLHEVKFHFESFRKDKPIDLQKFIEKLNNAAWKLVASSNKNVIIYEDIIGFGLYISSTFKLEFTISSTNLKNRVDYLLRMSRPKTLLLLSSLDSDLLKFLCEKIINREVNPSCCEYYKKKCWLHYLEAVEIIVYSETGDILCIVSTARGVESPEILPPAQYWTTFNLKWRPISEET